MALKEIKDFTETTTLAYNDKFLVQLGSDDSTKHITEKNLAGSLIADFSPPQGSLINGKISRTVTSNNITVAIKTLAGSDPSASDPVYVRIGDTVRTITSALSVTKNAGTNWFDSGSTSLATYEVDYFVYLGYNATDGVVIGFARIPYARVYGDFSATSTNDKYCAISTITNAASTDEYEVVGRFNATLSATASFNWSIPATSIIINRPIFKTRQLTYASQWTASSVNPTLGSSTMTSVYQIDLDMVDITINLSITTGGAFNDGTGSYRFGTPITVDASPTTVGGAQVFDSGTTDYIARCTVAATTYLALAYANASVSDTTPMTPATGDAYVMTIRARLV